MAELADDIDPMVLDGTPYQVVGLLGRGGMGVVLSAEHRKLGKPVVVKLLHRSLADRPDLSDRLRFEAQTLARLRHTNLVDVTDYGVAHDGRSYIVMERLYGRTLRDEIGKSGKLAVNDAIDIVRQALAGLAAAHDAGVIHRDLKLDNIFLCDGDATGKRVVKLLDFGIAKTLASASGDVPKPIAFPTEQGILIGTPRYLSPEQARGETVDVRTDVYALGIVLYTLLVGRGPFHHLTNAVDILRAQLLDPPPPAPSTAIEPAQTHTIPSWLDAVVMKAIERRREARFPTARAFSDALRPSAANMTATSPLPVEVRPAKWQQTELLDPPTVLNARVVSEEPASSEEPTILDPESVETLVALSKPKPQARSASLFLALVLLSMVVFMILIEIIRRVGGP